MRRSSRRRSILAAAILALTVAAPARAETVTVFAAASLTNVVGTVAETFTGETGIVVATSFAASSTLARQIEAGAPADLYLSADTVWMDYLADRGLVDAPSRRIAAGNRLVVIIPAGGLEPDGPMPAAASEIAQGLRERLGEDGRLALADPAHVPAGRYAEAALRAIGSWPDLADRLAPAADVRAAVTLVARGEAPVGIVYATDARAVDAVVARWLVPETTHPAVIYPVAVVAGRARPAVLAFLESLTGADGRAVFQQFGFVLP